MPSDKQDIIRRLQEEILPLQGFRPPTPGARLDMGLGPIVNAFPQNLFPTGAVHELLSASKEDAAATSGFISALLNPLMRRGGVCLWIGTKRTVFPAALKSFGITPDQIVFIDLAKEKDATWAMEEALKCEGLAAVVGEIREIDFTASRKLQLAVEKSRVTGFLLRHQPKIIGTVAAVARWKISTLASQPEEELPGVGFPRWKVQLLKVRNGMPGQWIVEWAAGRLQVGQNDEKNSTSGVTKPTAEPMIATHQKRKTG